MVGDDPRSEKILAKVIMIMTNRETGGDFAVRGHFAEG